ncbi:MAG TPA: tetratricopeptide repeat protein [Tepidisphaeraceae bacterium]|jgi:tetratricopeptide (TPR) repeat protein
MLLAATAVAASAWLVYGGSLRAPFIFDDVDAIDKNPSVTHPVSAWNALNPPFYKPTSARPLANLSLAINYRLGGMNPLGYHALNMILHIGTAILLLAVLHRALLLDYFQGKFDNAALPLAACCALLWAVHPLQTEAVQYVTQRTEIMAGLFYFATVYSALRFWAAGSKAARAVWLILAALACIFGMASKQMMVSALPVILIFERTFVAGSFRSALRRSFPLYLALLPGYVLLYFLNRAGPHASSAGFHTSVSAHDWWMTQSKVLFMYLKLAIWPFPLAMHYDITYLRSIGDAWMWLTMAACLTAAGLVLLWRRYAAGFVIVSVLLILSPTLIVPMPSEIAAERRMYLPLAAIITLVVTSFCRFLDGRGFPTKTAFAAGTVSLVFGWISFNRVALYRDPMALWTDTLEHQSNDFLALTNLADCFMNVGDYHRAGDLLQRAALVRPHDATIWNTLGVIGLQTGRNADAVASFKAGLSRVPNDQKLLNNLALALLMSGRLPEAEEACQNALRADPNDVVAWTNLGQLTAQQGQIDKAIEYFQHAIALRPDDPANLDAYRSLGKAYLATGKPAEAIGAYQHALRLNPGDAISCCKLGDAYLQTGRADFASEQFTKALAIRPKYPDALEGMGDAMKESGRLKEAQEHFRAAIDLNPQNAGVFFKLAQVYDLQGQTSSAARSAELALRLAAEQGQTALAAKVQEWITKHQKSQSPGN